MDEYYIHSEIIYPEDDSLYEMMEVGRFEDFKICVYGKEGPIPHFHFYPPGHLEKEGGCIRLDEPEYFNHGSYKATLNKRNIKRMIEWMSQPHKYWGKYGETNWDLLVLDWNDQNSNFPLPKSTKQPNYLELGGNK